MSQSGDGKVLLLHPDDDPLSFPELKWSLIVDLGRAPESTYQSWGRHFACPVMSLFDLAEGTDDLNRTRELLECGMGEAVDNFGIDWWDVLAQSIVPQIQQLILLRRLATTIDTGADVYSTRPHYLASALQNLLGGKLITVQSASQRMFHAVRHYADALQQLEFAQLTQVIQDKFDPQHKIRRLTADRPKSSGRPFVLLPSAYVNVVRRNHGMALGSTMTAFGGKAPTTWLPLLLSQVGPAKWIATTPSALNSVASGTAVPQLEPFQV